MFQHGSVFVFIEIYYIQYIGIDLYLIDSFLFPLSLSQVGWSMDALIEETGSAHPFHLYVSKRKNSIQNFYIVLDQKMIPCAMQTGVAAFDELFKAHFAFSMSYDQELCNFTFLQSTVYGIYVGSVKESPRVKEIRARICHSAVWGGTHLGLCSPVTTARYPAQVYCYSNIKFQHCFYPGKSLCLNCGEPGCSFVFCTYSGYKHHLSRAHGDSIDSHPVRRFEFEPAANVVVGPSVSSKCGSSCDCQYTQSSWYKESPEHMQLYYCSNASFRSSWKHLCLVGSIGEGG